MAKGVCTKLLPFHEKEMYSITFWCVDGCCQPSRGTNKRIVCSTCFTGCPARITGELREKPNGDSWHVVIINEIAMHNHAVSEEVYRTYDKSAQVATGKGVWVCDFLCVSQSSEMMRTVFEFFVEHNPSAKNILQSVVIDKDFREWKAIVAVFQVSVVLCIFHVLKWFKFVITRPKYSIGFAIRDAVLQCLRNMVYAVSHEALEAQKIVLRGLLDPGKNVGHAAFLKYMEANWYGDAVMWCYAGRGAIFTAGNTTSNRLESFWNQFKALLGMRRRLDCCLETSFQHGTAILRREKELLQGYITASPSLHDVDQKLRSLLMDLSPYAAKQVKAQWVKFKARSGRYTATRARPHAGDPHCTHTLHVAGTRAVDFAVSATAWTCSCHFYRGVRLPCRHIFYVMDVVQDMAVYPARAVPKRWRMSEYGLILPILSRSISDLEQLRTYLLQTSYLTDYPLPCPGAAPPGRASLGRTIVYTTLRKNEISDSAVMGDIQKRNECERVLDKVRVWDDAARASLQGFHVRHRGTCGRHADEVVSEDESCAHTARTRLAVRSYRAASCAR